MKRRRQETVEAAPATPGEPTVSRWRATVHLWVPALLALVVWAPSLLGGFIYDDIRVIVGNRGIRDLFALRTVLRADPSRPVVALSWAANYAVAGLAPWPWHLVNVLLHAANAALAGALLLWISRRAGLERPARAALLGACCFAATPMAAETVACVASRSTELSTLFVLASLVTVAPALVQPSRGRVAAGLVLAVLGLAAKEEAASLPFFLLLLDAFFVAGSLREVWQRRRVHLPFLALLVVGLLARRAVLGEWLPAPVVPRGTYLLTQAAAFGGYVLRALFPLDPAFFRGARMSSWPPGMPTIGGLLVSALVIAVAFSARRRFPAVAFAVAWMAAGLLPSSSLVPLNEPVVDHRAYLGALGIAWGLGLLMAGAGRLAFATAVLLLMTSMAVRYQWILADHVLAWEDALAHAPESPEARWALAEAYDMAGDPRAEEIYRSAAANGDVRSLANLASYLMGRGRLDEAIEVLQDAVRRVPDSAQLLDNLGMALQAQGRFVEALATYERAVKGTPPLAQPRINLAALLMDEGGDTARAKELLDQAAALDFDEQDALAIQALRSRLH